MIADTGSMIMLTRKRSQLTTQLLNRFPDATLPHRHVHKRSHSLSTCFLKHCFGFLRFCCYCCCPFAIVVAVVFTIVVLIVALVVIIVVIATLIDW